MGALAQNMTDMAYFQGVTNPVNYAQQVLDHNRNGNYTISETSGLDDFLKLDWIQHFQETIQRLISLRAKVQ